MIKTAILSLVFLVTVNVDRSKVRFGDVEAFLKSQNGEVGVVESKTVYKSIPAYQTLINEKVKRDTARWFKLMSMATEEYKRCIKSVAESQKLVLVVEVGCITGYPVTSITNACIEKVKTIIIITPPPAYPKSQKSKAHI